jgi:hypothetical protein
MIACHYLQPGSLHCSGRGKAAAFVTPETAEDLVFTGEAEWGNKRGTYLVFTKREAEISRASESLTMGPAVMDGFVDGCLRHVAMVNAWGGARA